VKKDIGKILRKLCEHKGVKIIEAELYPDHIHILITIPPKKLITHENRITFNNKKVNKETFCNKKCT